MDDANEALIAALESFIEDALALRDEFDGRATEPGKQSRVEGFAATLEKRASTEAANRAALETAEANNYLLREGLAAERRGAAGRRLNQDAIVATGIAGLLLTEQGIDPPALARELAAYLAGPAVPVWDYAIVNAELTVSDAIQIVDGWDLVAPKTAELAKLVGVPSAARWLPHPPFDLDLYGGLAMLRRVDSEGRPHTGSIVSFDFRPPAHRLWEPLLALSLFQNAVVQLWGQFRVEPGRRVDVVFDRVYTEPWTPDGVTELEIVVHGDYRIDKGIEVRFRQFMRAFEPLLAAVVNPERSAETKRGARLRRVAEHFLTASEDAHGEGEVLSELNADAVLHYVIALEAMVSADDPDKSDLTRKVAQRAAVIAGVDDRSRHLIERTVRAAYAARSAYAHGDEPRNVELPELRRIVRACLLARLIVGDPVVGGTSLGQLADAALLDHRLLMERLRNPIDEFWSAVDGS